MALKKSELYSSLWASCDELRGGMDASQYKDYVLVLLFIKYISDKYAGQQYSPITIPEGASFKDMVALKGKPTIGDDINKKIIGPLANANKLSDMPDFNDATKLGTGKEMVERLTNLIAIFENKALDFSKNRADGDDILGDAYEYLMRHFATESGKSKGQFYTPAEVSRIMAQIIGIRNATTTAATTVYDPTCGSGSLLLKVGDEAAAQVTLYGQEKDAATSGLARMNMILHDKPTAQIVQGNTLADPKFREGESLKTFDYVVANPPFSDKRWSNGIDPLNDPYDRFKIFGTPPGKQGDYAYLLHIVRSLKSAGKAACILPHGVLFRGNAEADIRRNLVRKGYIQGIIGLPPNLFYGTGIPACIVVIDKEHAHARKGIFMVDASGGFVKDGPKNRLRSMDIHKIVDAFNKRLELPKYSRMVSVDEIEKNDFNLNLPRYIDSQVPEDIQDIAGHLKGGIPVSDIDALQRYWDICPELRHSLFRERRSGYLDLAVEKPEIKSAIYDHVEFAAFIDAMNAHFDGWRRNSSASLKLLAAGCHPKEIVASLSENLLDHYSGKPLIDAYDIYQHLMDYWHETMQDDCYLIAADGWKAETTRLIERDKKGREKDKGWTCDLIPKTLVIARHFGQEQAAIDKLAAELESTILRIKEMEDEYGGDEGILRAVTNKTDARAVWTEALESAWVELMPSDYGAFRSVASKRNESQRRVAELIDHPYLQALKNDKGNITNTAINKRKATPIAEDEMIVLDEYLVSRNALKRLRLEEKSMREASEKRIGDRLMLDATSEAFTDVRILDAWFTLNSGLNELQKRLVDAEVALDREVHSKYAGLTGDEIKTLVVDDKWLGALDAAVHGEVDRVSRQITQRVNELAERYEAPMPHVTNRVAELEARVKHHLASMGFGWN